MHPSFALLRSYALLALPGALLAAAVFPSQASAASFRDLPSVTLTAGEYSQTFAPSAVGSWMDLTTSLGYDPDHTSQVEDTSYCPVDQRLCAFSLSRFARQHLRVRLASDPDPDAVAAFVKDFASHVDQDPKDAVFAADSAGNITVASKEEEGRVLDQEKSAQLITQALESPTAASVKIALPTVTAQPKIRASEKDKLGLKDLIGVGQSNFKGSTKNRIYNINRSLQQFQNVIIAPGEDFSFVGHLGEVDGEHGYLPELVIKDNKTEPEFGGGICQVSTTVFRAAIYSGLKITARRNHAYPVHYYYPYGMDATVYVPKPDLTFTNNTGHYILMQSTIEGTELTFKFFGTKDGRTISVDGPHVLESNPDGSMKTVFTQTVKDSSGTTFINDNFWSNYKSPSLFPRPGAENQVLTSKPENWSKKQWEDYKKIHP